MKANRSRVPESSRSSMSSREIESSFEASSTTQPKSSTLGASSNTTTVPSDANQASERRALSENLNARANRPSQRHIVSSPSGAGNRRSASGLDHVTLPIVQG